MYVFLRGLLLISRKLTSKAQDRPSRAIVYCGELEFAAWVQVTRTGECVRSGDTRTEVQEWWLVHLLVHTARACAFSRPRP